jgi:hypothetical protein
MRMKHLPTILKHATRMLRDNTNTYSPPAADDLDAKPNLEILLILDFIDQSIPAFRPYYLTIRDSDRENRVTDFLVHHLQLCLREGKWQGFPPFDFRKNPTQPASGRETDIGVLVLSRNIKPVTIIEFESKRFSKVSSNTDYVYGNVGGIERFKRGLHGEHLSVCGMFGYIQHQDFLNAAERINGWIAELAVANTDTTIDWTLHSERLVPAGQFSDATKWSSVNVRRNQNAIKLYHYLLDLSVRTN